MLDTTALAVADLLRRYDDDKETLGEVCGSIARLQVENAALRESVRELELRLYRHQRRDILRDLRGDIRGV